MRDPMEAFEDWLAKKPRLWPLYVRLNFCKAKLADGADKPESGAFNLLARIFYLECACCAALRGFLIGGLIGALIGLALGG